MRTPADAVQTACREALDEETVARATAGCEAMTAESLFEYLETRGSVQVALESGK